MGLSRASSNAIVVVAALLLLLTAAAATASSGILSNETDRMALLEFKSMISGDPLGVLSSWNDSTHFCGWHGVSCSKRHVGRVTVLDLNSLKLSGSISPHIGNLSFLKELALFNNSFSKGIPSEICRLHRLQRLGLFDNSLGGEIPSNISACSDNNLYMSGTRISGSIPNGIHKLVGLQVFDASNNNLSAGTIPSSIGNMQNLQSLILRNSGITGNIPISIGNCTRLINLDLATNNLYGDIPANIGKCQNLLHLDLSENDLNGLIPTQVVSIVSLATLLNLSYNQFTGALPVEVQNLKNLAALDLSHNMLSGNIPSSLGSCVILVLVNLQGNLFQGPIPSSLSSLRGMEHLDVSFNNLSGTIPKFFEDMKFLKLLNMSYNNFEGEVPQGGVLGNGTIISIMGNSKLCGGFAGLNLPPCSFLRYPKRKLSLKWKIIITTISILLFLTFMGSCLIIFWIKKRGKPDVVSSRDLEMQLSYQKLFKATGGFSTRTLIGFGSFGSMYRGVLENRTTIAVKVFNLHRRGASKSFMAECEALKNIRHRNLVRIITACSGVDHQGNDFKALIYEFMSNGSLEDWLHPVQSIDETARCLHFHQRLNVAIDIAYALDYLHHLCGTPIIHCDLKPSNILLDEEKVGHVADFGLARILSSSVNNPSTMGEISSSIGIKGTIGYAPPEYGMGNEVSTQGDVYSYGILLLELFTGRRPTDEIFRDGLSLQTFVKSTALSQDRLLTEVVDPTLLSELLLDKTLEESLISILNIGVACSSDIPQERQSINKVLASLKKLIT